MKEYIKFAPYLCREIARDLRRKWYYLPSFAVGIAAIGGLFFEETRPYSILFFILTGSGLGVSEALYGKPLGVFPGGIFRKYRR